MMMMMIKNFIFSNNLYFSPPKVLATEVVMREVQEPTTPREQLELHAAGVTVRL